MRTVLENPVWHALHTGNQNLALGSGRVKYFDEEVSPFAAMQDDTVESWRALSAIEPRKRGTLLFTLKEVALPAAWKLIALIPGLQMVYESQTPLQVDKNNIVALQSEAIPAMIALTELTKPGPFGLRTIEFGNYEGIYSNDQLVAMTGQRFHPGNYVEISAVCTDPGFTGRGYARQLLSSQVNQILSTGQVPILHVRADNERAIEVYQQLGFVVSREVFFYVMKRPGVDG